MNFEISNFPDTLKELRREYGFSLREFSEISGLSHTYVNQLEKASSFRGDKPILPSIETLGRIATAFDMPLNKFLNICGFSKKSYVLNETYYGASVNVEAEISKIRALLMGDVEITLGSKTLDEQAKKAMNDELLVLVAKIKQLCKK